MRTQADGTEEVVEEHPDLPYDGARIVSSQAAVLNELSTGVNSTMYWVKEIKAYGEAVKLVIELWCNHTEVFWCH